MKNAMIVAAACVLAAAVPASAGSNGSIAGDYVEARTAEVFTGGCIMGSQAETIGREALLAWRIDRGTYAGVSLDGLAVVAALAGDHNLGIREMGGRTARVSAAIVVDGRASAAQRDALVAFVREMTGDLVDQVVQVEAAPIRFAREAGRIAVSTAGVDLDVATRMEHGPSCGAMQWFHPFAAGTEAAVGTTRLQAYSGTALNARWRQVDARSAFFGTFSY
jgi:hypothetical protein